MKPQFSGHWTSDKEGQGRETSEMSFMICPQLTAWRGFSRPQARRGDVSRARSTPWVEMELTGWRGQGSSSSQDRGTRKEKTAQRAPKLFRGTP